jgi:membrane-bound ClpP family serine protease
MSAVALRSSGCEPKGRFIAMQHDVPRWIGLVGMVLVLALCGFAFAGQVLFTVLLIIASVALVVLENRNERGLIGERRE